MTLLNEMIKDYNRVATMASDTAFAKVMTRKEMIWRGIATLPILKQRITMMKKTAADRLPPAFPSAPTRAAKYELRMNKLNGNVSLHLFSAKYSAARYLQMVLKDQDWEFEDSTHITCPICVIASDHLEELMDHEDTKREACWEMPEPYATYIRAIRGESREQYQEPEPMVTKEKKAKKSKKPRATKKIDGMITLAEICETQGWESKKARQALRRGKIERPGSSWAWPEKKVKKVTKQIKENWK